MIALALLLFAAAAGLMWLGWRDIVFAWQRVRVVLRRRKLRDAIVEHLRTGAGVYFHPGAEKLDIDVLAMKLAGEDPLRGIRKLPPGRRREVERLVHELTVVADKMTPTILKPLEFDFDFNVRGAQQARTETGLPLPGNYTLTPEGRALIGGIDG